VLAMETSAVLGAGGGIGNAVVWELSRRGLRARAVSRKADARVPDDVEVCAADLATPEGAARACADAAVVYHCVQPRYTRWAREFPALNDTIVAAVQRAGAKLVVADNLYMYGPITGPISETTQQEPRSRKGRLRKQLAESLLAAAETAGLRVTIGRASDYFGPEGAHSVAGRMVTNALVGKTVRWPANADFPHTFSYLPDVARGLVVLGERDEANGEVWVLPAAPPITARAFVALIGQACGQPVKLSVTSKLAMRVAGLAIPDARDLPDIWYQFAAPFVVDGSTFDRAFGPLQVTSLSQAVRDTIAWYSRSKLPAELARNDTIGAI
jgi:nucleoside-diphosphate-sugar epimerase